MRLLNTSTITVHEFVNVDQPYAILSHRWEDEEVTFQDLNAGRGPNMRGYRKLESFCRQARSDGWEWVWMDTCCIDKQSSAELSEAINSMFAWYRQARICYAYLSDVPRLEDPSLHQVEGSAFRRSQWFSRGWTLQELLAPDYLIFYDQTWFEIGTKSELRNLVQSITGISNLMRYEEACIARKMSWASKRMTTRIEDRAYCLMGIFGVNMPLLYGEGSKAFTRLQLEIIKDSSDDSIFAWFGGDNPNNNPLTGGLLAPSVSSFESSADIVRLSSDPGNHPPLRMMNKSYVMTNKGLRIVACQMPMEIYFKVLVVAGIRWDWHTGTCALILNCGSIKDGSSSRVYIGLGEPPYSDGHIVYFRGNISDRVTAAMKPSLEALDVFDVYVHQPAHREEPRNEAIIISVRYQSDFTRYWHIQFINFDPAVYQIKPESLTIGLRGSNFGARRYYSFCLQFQMRSSSGSSNPADRFVIIVLNDHRGFGMGVRVPRDGQDINPITEELLNLRSMYTNMYASEQEGSLRDLYRQDRVSHRLSSGKIVAFAVKPTSRPPEVEPGLRGRFYDLVIEEKDDPSTLVVSQNDVQDYGSLHWQKSLLWQETGEDLSLSSRMTSKLRKAYLRSRRRIYRIIT